LGEKSAVIGNLIKERDLLKSKVEELNNKCEENSKLKEKFEDVQTQY